MDKQFPKGVLRENGFFLPLKIFLICWCKRAISDGYVFVCALVGGDQVTMQSCKNANNSEYCNTINANNETESQAKLSKRYNGYEKMPERL
jgi:hypothetical protein